MRVIIKEQILIFPETNQELELIKKKAREELVFADPVEPRTGQGFQMQKMIAVFKYDSKKNYFVVPRGKQEFLGTLTKAGIKLTKLEDQRRLGAAISFKANFELRDKIQRLAFKNYLASKTNMGILNLGCGIGKLTY